MSSNPEISFDVPLTRAECSYLIEVLHSDESNLVCLAKLASKGSNIVEGQFAQAIAENIALRRKLEEYCYGYSTE